VAKLKCEPRSQTQKLKFFLLSYAISKMSDRLVVQSQIRENTRIHLDLFFKAAYSFITFLFSMYCLLKTLTNALSN
jgi:hypothetical protein